MTVYTDKIHINCGGTIASITIDTEQTEFFNHARNEYKGFFAIDIDNEVTVRRYPENPSYSAILIFAASSFYVTTATLKEKFRIYL